MSETLQEKIELGLKISQKMIDDIEVKLNDAISRENWARAADLQSYINGMFQIHIIFQQAHE